MPSPCCVPPSDSPATPKGRKRTMNISEASGDANTRSTSLAMAMEESPRLEQKLGQELEDTTPDVGLRRMLSLRSTISTTSSFAERQQTAVGKVSNFRQIGKGSIGAVFEHPSTNKCYKLALLDNCNKIWNNYQIHTEVYEAFAKAETYINVAVRVPQMFWYANEQISGFWDENLHKFPFTKEYPEKRHNALCMERILPLPRLLRHLLIEKYCHGDQEEAKSYGPNQDCLVRPVLGRRRFGAGKIAFSLRNFSLHLNQFEELTLDIEGYAGAIADAMAILHCVAKVDAMDVEFAIGSAPTQLMASGVSLPSAAIRKMSPGTSTFEMVGAQDFVNREICLWVVDCDACNAIDLDLAGAKAAANAS